MEGFFTLLFALAAVAVVVYLSYLFSRFLASGTARLNRSKYIKVLDRAPLGQEQSLLVISVGEKGYLVGTSQQSVQILTELDEKQLADMLARDGEAPADVLDKGASFQELLSLVLKKKKKQSFK